jgi:predicted amidophosphoribosyltransferase
VAGLGQHGRRMFDALTDVLLPSRCAGCTAPRGPLCTRCRAGLVRPRPHRPDPDPPGLPPLAVAGAYAGPVRDAVLAYKERCRRDLAGPLGSALAAAVREVVSDRLRPGDVVLLVPVPSAAAVARRRGGQHVDRLAAVAARALRRRGVPAGLTPVLRLRGASSDTAELTAAERSRAAVGKFQADPARVRGVRAARSWRPPMRCMPVASRPPGRPQSRPHSGGTQSAQSSTTRHNDHWSNPPKDRSSG